MSVAQKKSEAKVEEDLINFESPFDQLADDLLGPAFEGVKDGIAEGSGSAAEGTEADKRKVAVPRGSGGEGGPVIHNHFSLKGLEKLVSGATRSSGGSSKSSATKKDEGEEAEDESAS